MPLLCAVVRPTTTRGAPTVPAHSPDESTQCPYGVRPFSGQEHAVPLLCPQIRRTNARVRQLGERFCRIKRLILCHLRRIPLSNAPRRGDGPVIEEGRVGHSTLFRGRGRRATRGGSGLWTWLGRPIPALGVSATRPWGDYSPTSVRPLPYLGVTITLPRCDHYPTLV